MKQIYVNICNSKPLSQMETKLIPRLLRDLVPLSTAPSFHGNGYTKPNFKMTESLWDIAVKENIEHSGTFNSTDKTLVFAGSKGVGKTTLIYKFLDRNESVKQTLAIEYTFGRKSGRSLVKDICHIWELGGGTLYSNLLTAPFGSGPQETTLILMLDLSTPEQLWHPFETLLQTSYKQLRRTETSRSIGDTTDSQYITPFPIPLVIIGGKYDLFDHFDMEKKKLIIKTLRQVAHSLNASLLFYTDKDASLVKKMKDVFNFYGFGGSPWKGFSTDYNKPVLIPAGSDTYEQIGINVSTLPANPQGLMLLERIKHTYTTHIPQVNPEAEDVTTEDPALDNNFKEPYIDILRAQKDEDLDRLMREVENRRKLQVV